MERSLHAWVDESIYSADSGVGLYILAASLSEPDQAEFIRERLRALRRPGWLRLHWREEEEKDRDRIIATIGGFPVVHVVVCSPLGSSRQERARRKGMERLLFELDRLRVARVWIEARQAVQDRDDQQMVAALVGAGVIPRSLVVDFAKPLDEPMLWIPDAVAGMTNQVQRTGECGRRRLLGQSYELIML